MVQADAAFELTAVAEKFVPGENQEFFVAENLIFVDKFVTD